MPFFILQLQASGSFTADIPTLSVQVGGLTIESENIDVGSNTYSFSLPYTGALPASLSFEFNDGKAEGGRSITISTVSINGEDVTAQLSGGTLNSGGTSTVDVSSLEAIFGQTEPDVTDYTVTVTGTPGIDRGYSGVETGINGTAGDDVIDALAGNDRIISNGGNDVIFGGDGNDQIYGSADQDLLVGGADNDQLRGNAGDDTLFGGTGNDRLLGGDDNDTLFGGDGDDRLIGQNGNDIMLGQDGADTLTGGNGEDQMSGGAGDDRLLGGNDNDTLFGDSGADILSGNAGDDIIHGGDDNDRLIGDSGDDILHGDAGDDILLGRTGNDTIYGGDGADTVYEEEGDDTIHGGDGADNIVGGEGADTIFGDAGNDILHGHSVDHIDVYTLAQANPGLLFSAKTNSFYMYVDSAVTWDAARSAAASYSLNGVSGHLATITSDIENQIIYDLGVENGASSANRIWLGATDEATDGVWLWDGGIEGGLQLSSGGTSTNNLYENWGSGQPNNSGGAQEYATMWFNGGSDDSTWDDRDASDNAHDYVIEWDAGLMNDDNAVDTIDGGAGNDYIYGYGGNDILNGGADNDVVFGGDDDDIISGDAGNDVLLGQSGNDTITGGDGADTIYGGADDDDIDGGNNNDTIYGDALPTATNILMEAGTTTAQQTTDTDWFTVNFSGTIENAVVKMFAQDVGGDPFTLRVRNVTSDGFEFQLDEFDYQDGATALETLSWLAVSEGSHTLADGTQVQAGYTTATNESGTNVNFVDTTYSSPVVFTQVSSDNDLSAVVVRNDDVSSTGFNLEMNEEESADGTHATEDIGWIAFETGGSPATGILVGSTGDVVTHNTTTINFGSAFGATPIFLADMQGDDGGDTAYTAGVSGLSTTQAQVFVDEEQSGDGETNHTTEEVGYVALNSGIYTLSGGPGGSDVIRGGDGDDILYADSEVDTNVTTVSDVSPLRDAINGDNPVGYWQLNEGSGTTADNIGSLDSAVDGTINGSPTFGASALYTSGDTAIDFDGTNDGIRIPDSTSINSAVLPAKTVELVFNADDVTTRQVIYEEGGGTHGLTMYVDGGDFYITGEHDGNWADVNFSTSISTGVSYHAAFVFSSANDSFEGFLNGVSLGSISVNGQDFPSHSGDIGIGYAPDGVQFHDGESSGPGFYFDGRISDVAIYTSALSDNDIQARADIVQGLTPSGGAIDDTLYGGDGFDQFFAGEGRDVFVFEMASAFNDVDEINGFDMGEQDALDISDIITGFDALSDDINDFVQVVDSGTNTLVQVDANGTAGGSNYQTIAQINDVGGLDVDTLYLNANFVV